MGALDDLNDQAASAVAWFEARTILPALQGEGRRVQAQSALLLRRAVALVASLGQERLHLAEIVHRSPGDDRCGQAAAKQTEQSQLH